MLPALGNGSSQSEGKGAVVRQSLLCLLLFAPSVLSLLSTPTPLLPEYPALAHVVPDDNIPGHIGALVGPSSALPVIDRKSLKESLAIPVLAVFACVCLLLPLSRVEQARKLIWASVLVCGLALLDTVFPEEISQISPLAALSRVVPGLFFVPLAPLCLALGISILALGLMALDRGRLALAAGCCVLLPGALASALNAQQLPLSEILYGQTIARDVNKLSDSNALSVRTLPTETRTRLISPSFRLAKEYGGRPVVEQSRYLNWNFITPNAAPNATVSGNAQEVPNLFDNNPATRWASGAHPQRGDEWIHLQFQAAQRLDGIELATGNWRWDFPRGLEIRYSEECTDAAPPSPAVYKPIVHNDSWQGRVEFTDDGFPYYGGQDLVQLAFSRTITARCLLIRQTAAHPVFQWSVAEIRTLPPQ